MSAEPIDAAVVEEGEEAQQPSVALEVATDDEVTELVRQIEHPEARMMRQAETLAKTNIIPKQYYGRPDDIVAAGLMGMSYGLDLMQALRCIHVVDGKPTMAAEAMLAMVRKHGHSVTGKKTRTAVTIVGKRADNGDSMEIEWTLEDAKAAGLLGKSNWKQYPRQMMWARAVSELCTSLFSDVTNGLYVYEEIQADLEVLDTKPDMVLDVETGELVPMTQPNPHVIDPAKVDDLLGRLESLPDDKRKAVEGWMVKELKVDPTHESISAIHPEWFDNIMGVIERAKTGKKRKVSLPEQVRNLRDALDDEKREEFNAYCQENSLPERVSGSTAEIELNKMFAWLKANAGEEPFIEEAEVVEEES